MNVVSLPTRIGLTLALALLLVLPTGGMFSALAEGPSITDATQLPPEMEAQTSAPQDPKQRATEEGRLQDGRYTATYSSATHGDFPLSGAAYFNFPASGGMAVSLCGEGRAGPSEQVSIRIDTSVGDPPGEYDTPQVMGSVGTSDNQFVRFMLERDNPGRAMLTTGSDGLVVGTMEADVWEGFGRSGTFEVSFRAMPGDRGDC